MYYIIANQWEGKNYCLSFPEEAEESYSHMTMYFRTWFSTIEYRKLSQCLHVLFLWWSGTVVTVLRSLKSGIREYISPRINFHLYRYFLCLLLMCTKFPFNGIFFMSQAICPQEANEHLKWLEVTQIWCAVYLEHRTQTSKWGLGTTLVSPWLYTLFVAHCLLQKSWASKILSFSSSHELIHH